MLKYTEDGKVILDGYENRVYITYGKEENRINIRLNVNDMKDLRESLDQAIELHEKWFNHRY